jgi:hypothetical protein
MTMINPLFAITDGDIRVSFFGKRNGIHIIDWTPSVAADKEGGTWQGSAIGDGRQLVLRPRDNIVDSLTLVFNNDNIDAIARDTQNLRRLLEKAMQYWTTKWQNEPVWIEARGDCETETRYALIMGYSTPNDDNPFEPPLGGYGLTHAMDSFPLVLEHGFWKPYKPGDSECLPISADDCWCQPSYLIFNGTTSEVNCGSDASIDNLADNAFTAEAWVYALGYGEANVGQIFNKTGAAAHGWNFYINNATGLYTRIYCAVTDATTSSGLANFLLNQWNHVAITWNDAADRYIRMFINGVQYGVPVQASGAIVADAADDLFIGNRSTNDWTWNGYIGWTRISNFVRYTANFTPPARCKIPEPDANTLAIWIREGQGAAIDNYQGLAACDGVAANCTWGCDCECDE